MNSKKNTAYSARYMAANLPQINIKLFNQRQSQRKPFLDGKNIGANFFSVFPRKPQNKIAHGLVTVFGFKKDGLQGFFSVHD